MCVAGKTVLSHCYTRAIPHVRFGDKWLIIKRYINSFVYMPTHHLAHGNQSSTISSFITPLMSVDIM